MSDQSEGAASTSAAHCSECREMADEFGLEGDDIERLNQWHEDHPGWALVPDELLAMTRYTTEAESV